MSVLLAGMMTVVSCGCDQSVSVDIPITAVTDASPAAVVPVRTWEQKLGSVFTPVPEGKAPQITELAIPTIPGGHAVWGSTGRDDQGSLWFGVAVHGKPSAHLLEYDPATDQFSDRGNVVSQLQQCGIYRESEARMKIHSKFYQADDGFLYFASMDETDEEEDGSRYPTWGGHLWRMNLETHQWEHLLATKEALIAVAGAGRWIYALGYFNHVVYQYDTETEQIRSHAVGSVGGHVSRNFIADARGHVYVPAVEESLDTVEGPDDDPKLSASLVELDTELREVNRTPMEHYDATRDFDSHGIIAFTFLQDQSCVFSTHTGFLYQIRPADDDSAAAVEELGYFHLDGEAYASSLFTFDGRKLLVGQANKKPKLRHWIVCDLESRSSHLAEGVTGQDCFDQHKLLLYGTHTRDNAGNFYAVGRKQGEAGKDPVILKISYTNASAVLNELP